MNRFPVNEKLVLPLAGVLVGLAAVGLSALGNPANMALCIACFLRDTAGALGLHRAAAVQYLRPEIVGIALGAFAAALLSREHAVRGGSAPLTRFVLGFSVMTGALIFLGCPLRMLLRVAGGDLNALAGLPGFVLGIGTGVLFLNRGFTLQKSRPLPRAEGLVLPAANLGLLFLLVALPSVLLFSESGPGAQHAPVWASLAAGLAVGALGQRTRLCFIGGVRDAMLFGQFRMVWAFAALTATVLAGNLLMGKFHLGFAGQPIAHTDTLWNVLGLYLVGFASTLLGGCPFRQLVLAGSGSTDAAVTVLGMLAGAAFAHNFALASSVQGVTAGGKAAFAVCLLATLALAAANTKRLPNN